MQLFKPKISLSQSDEALILAYQKSGDSKLVGELFQRYAHLVFGVCMKYIKDVDEAQDITMQVFEKLLSDLKHHEVNHFKGWLYMVSKNHCLMQIRKKKGKIFVELDAKKGNENDENVENDVIDHLDDVQLKEDHLLVLEEGIKNLNGAQKTCIELFYLQDKSYVEIVSITGFDLKSVKSYIQNGKRNLKIYIEKKSAEE